MRKTTVTLAVLLLSLTGLILRAQDAGRPLYLDESAAVDARVEDLLGRLTVDEKIDLLRATSPGVPRLGIPKYYHGNEALHGIVRPGKFTVFPQAIGLASTWDPAFLQEVSGVISDEARARWNELGRGSLQRAQFSDLLTFWSPTVNMARDPRWGRTPETYGEDPFLTGEMGAAFVRGLQGDDPRYLKVVSTPKHFAANNEEHNRFECNAVISEKQLREYYLPAYESCVRRGGAASIMSAYNAINGIPCTANEWLLTKVLREDWGFQGYVVSDCGAPSCLLDDHHYVASREEAAAAALLAGLDLECGDNIFIEPLRKALDMGLVQESDIDRAVRNVLRSKMRLGVFDDPECNPYNQLSPDIVGSPEHRALALEAARKCLVLLKNEKKFLPLDADKLASLAVVGLNADVCEFGDYSGEPMGTPVSILDGIKALVGDKVDVRHAPWGSGEELDLAKASDVVVAVMGINRSIEREGKDRDDLGLPADQEAFLRALYEVNPNIVLVLVAGSSLSIGWEDEHIPAILDAWYPGELGGTAVAEALFGAYNPAGRLPLTWYRSLEDLPPFDDYDITKRTYKYFEGPVLYPFGHGLSYSTFKYSRLRVKDRGETVEVSLKLKNRGRLAGDEVVQVYVRLPEYEGKAPVKELRAFQRVHLKKGERKRVTIPIRREDLRYWSVDRQCFVVPEGRLQVFVGSSSADIRLKKTKRIH
jgi:beta-glucosidase-like glycosyl hydrolase